MNRKNKIEHDLGRKVGKAINIYGMIREGDRVLVGVSGGKDSLTLLNILEMRKKWIPVDYELLAVHVTTDYDERPEMKKDVIKEFVDSIGVECIFEDVAIAEKNKLDREDCFWCSWNRRKAIFRTAEKTGSDKIALGHHKDDIAETIMMNMVFNGELSSINPVQPLFGGKISLIRPLMLLEEKDIERYAETTGMPVTKSECPKNRTSKRFRVKQILEGLAARGQDIKSNIIRAPHRIRPEYLTDIVGDEEGWRDTGED